MSHDQDLIYFLNAVSVLCLTYFYPVYELLLFSMSKLLVTAKHNSCCIMWKSICSFYGCCSSSEFRKMEVGAGCCEPFQLVQQWKNINKLKRPNAKINAVYCCSWADVSVKNFEKACNCVRFTQQLYSCLKLSSFLKKILLIKKNFEHECVLKSNFS